MRKKIFLALLGLWVFLWASPAKENPILSAMESELNRSMKKLRMEKQKRPYFISYLVRDRKSIIIEGSRGSITESDRNHYRNLYVDLRVGDYRLDNSGVERKRWEWDEEGWRYRYVRLPIEDDTLALKHKLWQVTDYKYKKAIEEYKKKKREVALKPEKERPDDFSKEKPSIYIGEEVDLSLNIPEWEERIRKYSEIFNEYKDILISRVRFDAQALNRYFVNSEGSKIQDGSILYSLEIEAETRCKDGMLLRDLQRFYTWKDFWKDEEIEEKIRGIAKRIMRLKEAEPVKSYTGPVLIQSPASSAFFSAVLAPLLKGDKKRFEKEEGLLDKVGERILPPFVSVYDDPTIKSYKGEVLVGSYRFDDEGIPAQRVTLVDKGVLKNFLLSRSPIKGFNKSNGHGRMEGEKVAPKIGNLIIETSSPLPFTQLKERLIEECKRQGKPYGLLIKSVKLPEERFRGKRIRIFISGVSEKEGRPPLSGFPPLEVYKVYPDGREELVRGAEVLSSPPLSTLGKILGLGDDPKAFSISFGKSSVVAPSLLLSEIEIRRTKKDMRPPPILPPPRE